MEKSRGSNQLANLWNFRVNAEDTGGSFPRYSHLGLGGSRFRNIERTVRGNWLGNSVSSFDRYACIALAYGTISSPGLRSPRVISKRIFFSPTSPHPPFETNPASMYFKHFYGIVRSIRRDERNSLKRAPKRANVRSMY